RDERRDDEPGPLADERGDLIAERLAAAGRHEHERVAAGERGVDDGFLEAAEFGVAEDVAQELRGAVGGAADTVASAGLRGQVEERLLHARDVATCGPRAPRDLPAFAAETGLYAPRNQGYVGALDYIGRTLMASITIRDLDDQTTNRLRVRAARHKRSTEEEARGILRTAR